MKTHLAVSYTSKMFGADCHITTTLCGRESGESVDGANAECENEAVDCKLCRRIMANKSHWAHRKYLKL